MKPKKIPRIVKLWFILIGFWGGFIATLIIMTFLILGATWAFYLLGVESFGSIVLVFVIEWRYKDVLAAWGIGTPATELTKKVGEKI